MIVTAKRQLEKGGLGGMGKRINWSEKTIWGIYILMGAVFLPVLLCVFFLDQHIKYNEGRRLITLLPNIALFAVAVLVMIAVCLLASTLKKAELTGKANIAASLVLVLLFTGVYFVNERIAREIAYKCSWDIMVVSTSASYVALGTPLGYNFYFSIYTNNIPITYILKKLYAVAMEMKDYPYPSVRDFIWIQTNCVLLSVGGFFGCLTIKKLTKQIAPTIVYFLLYLALIGLSPWKIAPYTDTYGLAFPAMSVYFYLCYREAQTDIAKYLAMVLALVSAMAGGLVKPSVYIIVAAIFVVELICCIQDYKKRWKFILAGIILTMGMFYAKGAYTEHMIEELGLEFNDELGASWQHYFRMGQNAETTGSYSGDDTAIFGEFQTSRKERNKVLWERGLARVKEKGVMGNVSFWLTKMTMVFNDGSFGWGNEAGIQEHFPDGLTKNDKTTAFWRNIYWPEMIYLDRYHTFCQFVWIFSLIGISGFCFLAAGKREDYLILAVCFLGIYFYQLLFEARARYLIVFLPLLAVLSVSGIWRYMEWGASWLQRIKKQKMK